MWVWVWGYYRGRGGGGGGTIEEGGGVASAPLVRLKPVVRAERVLLYKLSPQRLLSYGRRLNIRLNF